MERKSIELRSGSKLRILSGVIKVLDKKKMLLEKPTRYRSLVHPRKILVDIRDICFGLTNTVSIGLTYVYELRGGKKF